MVGPAYVLRHYEVLVALHPRGATLGSEVVADIDPINPGVSPVRAGQAGSLRQGQGSNGDGDDGVHFSWSSNTQLMLYTKIPCTFIEITPLKFLERTNIKR